MSQLTETEINIRKQSLQADEAKVKETLVKLENERQNLMAQQYAISGAFVFKRFNQRRSGVGNYRQ